MKRKPTVAIVGRPNVGKSTFVNRLVGARHSIVDDLPGVTRDRIYFDVEWQNKGFTVIDTGGIIPGDDDDIMVSIFDQAKLACEEADKIIFQFPLFWFSTPALMKEWQDLVLSKIHYSANPKLLEGKKFSIITTAGGEAKSYDGHHGYSLETLLSPIKQAFSYSFCDVLESYAIFKAKPDNLPVQEYLKQLQ